jgi:His-Xaa-Ser system protein HxsD
MKLSLDKSAYSLEAVQKAAYRFIDRLTVVISTDELHVVCEIEALPNSQDDFAFNIDDFKRELLDQELRMKIKQETESTRNLILAYAFSNTGLQQ